MLSKEKGHIHDDIERQLWNKENRAEGLQDFIFGLNEPRLNSVVTWGTLSEISLWKVEMMDITPSEMMWIMMLLVISPRHLVIMPPRWSVLLRRDWKNWILITWWVSRGEAQELTEGQRQREINSEEQERLLKTWRLVEAYKRISSVFGWW